MRRCLSSIGERIADRSPSQQRCVSRTYYRNTKESPMRVKVSWQPLLLLGCISLTGCGSGHPSTVAVSGKVTLEGKAVAGANVVLSRGGGDITKGEIAIGKTDASGRFELTTPFAGLAAAKGAVPGSYKVTISK